MTFLRAAFYGCSLGLFLAILIGYVSARLRGGDELAGYMAILFTGPLTFFFGGLIGMGLTMRWRWMWISGAALLFLLLCFLAQDIYGYRSIPRGFGIAFEVKSPAEDAKPEDYTWLLCHDEFSCKLTPFHHWQTSAEGYWTSGMAVSEPHDRRYLMIGEERFTLDLPPGYVAKETQWSEWMSSGRIQMRWRVDRRQTK